VNNSGDISWHKARVFISEVFRFEELGFELITPGSYRVFFETWRSENSMRKSFALELHGEWSEFADECIRPWVLKKSVLFWDFGIEYSS